MSFNTIFIWRSNNITSTRATYKIESVRYSALTGMYQCIRNDSKAIFKLFPVIVSSSSQFTEYILGQLVLALVCTIEPMGLRQHLSHNHSSQLTIHYYICSKQRQSAGIPSKTPWAYSLNIKAIALKCIGMFCTYVKETCKKTCGKVRKMFICWSRRLKHLPLG